MGGKIKTLLINLSLLLLVMCLAVSFLILLDRYDQGHYKASAAYQDMVAAQYRAQTEAYKMDLVRVRLESEEARLQAFIKVYSEK